MLPAVTVPNSSVIAPSTTQTSSSPSRRSTRVRASAGARTRLLRLELQVLVGRREGVAGDEPEPGLFDAPADAVDVHRRLAPVATTSPRSFIIRDAGR